MGKEFVGNKNIEKIQLMEDNMGIYVYKSRKYMIKIHKFYDKALNSLKIQYEELYLDTSYGKTHILILGDKTKEKIFTLHGGNGINPLNIKLFKPLLEKYCIIAPDVIGMPGKSSAIRSLNSNKDDYGNWINEIMEQLHLNSTMFVVSSYSCAMLLSLAEIYPNRISKAVLLVPSGIAHGSLLPMISRMAFPFMKYYFHPTNKSLEGIMQTMVTDRDDMWKEFLHLMMSGYKMEMRPPREFKEKELCSFTSPVFIIASTNDIFFPADKVFRKSEKLFKGTIFKMTIEDRHLPSEEIMNKVCNRIIMFDKRTQ